MLLFLNSIMITVVGTAFLALLYFLYLSIPHIGPFTCLIITRLRGKFSNAICKLRTLISSVFKVLKWIGAGLVGLFAFFYTTFVMQCYWNWFLSRALSIHEISFFGMMGVLLFIQLIVEGYSSVREHNTQYRLKKFYELVFIFIPKEREDEVLSTIKEFDEQESEISKGFEIVFGKLFSNTTSLIIGFVVQSLI